MRSSGGSRCCAAPWTASRPRDAGDDGQAHTVPLTRLLLGERNLARATFEEFRHISGIAEAGPRRAALLSQIGAAVWLDDTETADRVYHKLSGLPPMHTGDNSGLVFSGSSAQRVTDDLALGLVTGHRQLSGSGNRGVLPVCHGERERRSPMVPGGA